MVLIYLIFIVKRFEVVRIMLFSWVRVGVRVRYILIIVYLYNKKYGSLQQFLCGKVGREQDSEAKVYGFKPWSGQQTC